MGTSTRWLAVSFLAVVATFIGSTVLVQHQAREIDAEAALISRDAAPGIQVISDLRGELREMQSHVVRAVLGRRSPDDVGASRQRVDRLLEAAGVAATHPPAG